MNIVAICKNCNNGTRINRLDDSVRCSTCDRNPASSKPSNSNGSLGKRTSATQTDTLETPAKKAKSHSSVVKDTVLTLMNNWFVEENDILSEGNEQLLATLEQSNWIQRRQNKDLRKKDLKIQLLELQLQSALRYSRMVEDWCPQVREMFQGDRDHMVAIQGLQNLELQGAIEAIDNEDGQETEEEEGLEIAI